MSARILVGGRAVYTTRDFPRTPAPQLLEHKTSQHVPAHHPQSPFRLGSAFEDPEDGITYRVVSPGILDPAQGWAPLAFWVKRWGVVASSVHLLAAIGLVDAAVELGSPTRRFRVRDESKARRYLHDAGKLRGPRPR